MTKRRFIMIAASVVGLSFLGYGIGWHTSLGRALRGVATVAVVNQSATPLQHVRFYLTDSRGRQIGRHFEYLQPHRTVRVSVRTADLIVRRIVYEQGQRAFTYDEGANVTSAEVFLIAVDSQGRMSGGYER